MNLKISYFSPSWPLFKENLRRFWAISALSFLVYFFTLAFPILLAYDNLSNLYDYIAMSLHNYNPAFIAAHGFFPLVTAVLIFRYLHSGSSATALHSMPYTRQKLFITNMLSGLFLLVMPILLNGLILLTISKPVFRSIGVASGMSASGFDANSSDVFTRGDILAWMGIAIVAIFFIYAISLLAGLLTGNSIMHFAMACLFNFIIPILLGSGIAYSSEFLWGYSLSSTTTDFILAFSPLSKLIQLWGNEFLSLLQIGIYIVAGILIMATTMFIYTKRKLERAGDSLVFHFMEPVVCYIITFLGMTAFGFLFAELNIDSNGTHRMYLYIGFVIGAVIAFMVGQMIVKKTPRIFNLKSLRDLAIYGIIALLFVGAMTFDITGYQKRIPSAKNVKSVVFDSHNFNMPTQIGYNTSNEFHLSSPQNIASLQAFHKDVIDKFTPKNFVSYFEMIDINEEHSYFNLTYTLGNGKRHARGYSLPNKVFVANKNLKKIFESSEWKNSILYKNSPITEMNEITLSTKTSVQPEGVTLKADEYAEFMECLDKDIKEMTYEEFMSVENPYCDINLYYQYKIPKMDNIENQYEETSIKKSFTHTIKWIEEHGYKDALSPSAKNIDRIDMFLTNMDAESTTLTITDPTEIMEILKSYDIRSTNFNYNLIGEVYLKGEQYNEEKNVNGYESYESTAATATDKADLAAWFQVYYSKENAPDFLLEKFEKAKK